MYLDNKHYVFRWRIFSLCSIIEQESLFIIILLITNESIITILSHFPIPQFSPVANYSVEKNLQFAAHSLIGVPSLSSCGKGSASEGTKVPSFSACVGTLKSESTDVSSLSTRKEILASEATGSSPFST